MKNLRLCLLLFLLIPSFAYAIDYTVQSPDGRITIVVTYIGQQVSYRVVKDGINIMNNLPLGINTSVGDFNSGLTFIASATTTINETYALPSGKRSSYINNCRQLVVRFSKSSREVQFIFRAYNDGIAYRYNIPGSGSITINGETSNFPIAGFERSWAMSYTKDYSTYYPGRDWAAMTSVGTFAAPALIRSNTNWFLITEAANFGNYSISKLRTGSTTGNLYLEKTGIINSSLPLATPWRVAIIGTLPAIVESTLIENLNPANQVADWSWIKPGKASWDWGGQEAKGTWATLAIARSYVDIAAEMRWEYFMLDDGWENAGYNIQDLINYATSKGVGVHLWSHHNKFQNDEAQIRGILQQWKSWGVKGVKVDFWEDDNQPMIQKYDKLLKVAGEQQLMVNLHGCTKPSGIRRQWPHLLTSEAVLGGEFYLFNWTMTPADHNINLALTRNVIGPMDYTPLDFADTRGKIKQNTTWSHQLALGIVYESGIQTMNDSPDNYRYLMSKEFLKKLPVAWDETRCLEASPEQYTTIARRKGNEWYVGSLANNARTLNLGLSFLSAGITYYANIYKDGGCDSEILYEQRQVTNGGSISLPLRTKGGVSIYFSTQPFPQPVVNKYEAESSANLFTGTTITADPDNRCSNNSYVGFIGSGNTLAFRNINAAAAGSYVMTVYYMTGENRNTYIKINSQASTTYSFTSSDGYNGNSLAMRSFAISLNAGGNTIEFGNATGWGINIDRIEIKKFNESCTPTAITPFLTVNGGAWQQTSFATLDAGGSVTIGPQPDNSGSWRWNGPSGFTSTTREITFGNIQPNQGGTYVATYTNTSGCESTHNFTITVTSGNVTTMYKDCNYGGTAVGLPIGDYTLTQLNSRGILNDDVSSLRVTSGYQVTLYENDNFSGASVVVSADNACLVGIGWNDRASSLRVATSTPVFNQQYEAENYISMAGVIKETCSEGGQNVGSFDTGDWTAYTITIPATGTYKVSYRVASLTANRTIRMEKDAGATLLGTVTIPTATGSWQTWTTVSHNITLPAGTYNIGLATATGGFNINWFSITNNLSGRLRSEEVSEALSSSSSDGLVYPNPVESNLFFNKISKGTLITIRNAQGIKVLETKFADTSIDLSTLAAGMYIIQINDGKTVKTKQIIKK